MLADLASELEEGHILGPVIIIDQFGTVGGIALEVEELGELLFDRLLVVAKGSLIEEIALSRLARGVTDHAGGAADQREGLMAATLKMTEHHHAAKVADM